MNKHQICNFVVFLIAASQQCNVLKYLNGIALVQGAHSSWIHDELMIKSWISDELMT